jgi:hypothetical protein
MKWALLAAALGSVAFVIYRDRQQRKAPTFTESMKRLWLVKADGDQQPSARVIYAEADRRRMALVVEPEPTPAPRTIWQEAVENWKRRHSA